MMRTTVNIEDDLLVEARQEALRRRISLGELLSEALKSALRRRPPRQAKAAPFRMITYGPTRPKVDHAPEDFDDALAADDERSLGR